jgi:hypothetical protein
MVIEPVPEKDKSAVRVALDKSPVTLRPLDTLKARAEGMQLGGSEAKTDKIEGSEIEAPAAIEIEEGSP